MITELLGKYSGRLWMTRHCYATKGFLSFKYFLTEFLSAWAFRLYYQRLVFLSLKFFFFLLTLQHFDNVKGFALEKSLKQRKASQSHTERIKTYHINSSFLSVFHQLKKVIKTNKKRINTETHTYRELEFYFILLHMKNKNLHKAVKAF